MNYNKVVEAWFFHPEHAGSLSKTSESVIIVSRSLDHSNRKMHLYLQLNEQRVVTAARFKAAGNPYIIAGLEWICRFVEGKNVDDLEENLYQDLLVALDIPSLQYPYALQLQAVYQEALSQLRVK